MEESLRSGALSRLGVQAPSLRLALLAWWETHGRHGLPWKLKPDGGRPTDGEPLDPLGIWVAEVMLQQTQLPVVLPYWHRWMAAWPQLEVLAAADQAEVLLMWQGLGYYSRARRLHQAARHLLTIATPGQDPWPRTAEGWLALPGLGRTTAGSILSSAFDQPFAILDGNVKRVLSRLTAHPVPPDRAAPAFWRFSEILLDSARPRAFNQALMDLGSGVCTPRSPACGVCPWNGACVAYANGDPARYPVKVASTAPPVSGDRRWPGF